MKFAWHFSIYFFVAAILGGSALARAYFSCSHLGHQHGPPLGRDDGQGIARPGYHDGAASSRDICLDGRLSVN
jgi:hypothetical protein